MNQILETIDKKTKKKILFRIHNSWCEKTAKQRKSAYISKKLISEIEISFGRCYTASRKMFRNPK